MSTFVYESPNNEVRVIVEADSEAEAYAQLQERLHALAAMRVIIDDRFELVSAY